MLKERPPKRRHALISELPGASKADGSRCPTLSPLDVLSLFFLGGLDDTLKPNLSARNLIWTLPKLRGRGG